MKISSIRRRWLVGSCALLLAAVLVIWGLSPDLFTLLATGDERELPAEPTADPALPNEPSLLLLAIDGVDRALLYEMLRAGELPMLASLLFAQGGQSRTRTSTSAFSQPCRRPHLRRGRRPLLGKSLLNTVWPETNTSFANNGVLLHQRRFPS